MQANYLSFGLVFPKRVCNAVKYFVSMAMFSFHVNPYFTQTQFLLPMHSICCFALTIVHLSRSFTFWLLAFFGHSLWLSGQKLQPTVSSLVCLTICAPFNLVYCCARARARVSLDCSFAVQLIPAGIHCFQQLQPMPVVSAQPV